MKKILTICFLISITVNAFAQTTPMSREDMEKVFGRGMSTLTERKNIICSNIWRLVEVTKKDQEGNFMPMQFRGLTFVFKTDGTTYIYINEAQKLAAEKKMDNNKYEISGGEITIHAIPKITYSYELENNYNQFVLRLTDESKGVTFVLFNQNK